MRSDQGRGRSGGLGISSQRGRFHGHRKTASWFGSGEYVPGSDSIRTEQALVEREGRADGAGEFAQLLDVVAVIERLVRQIEGDQASRAGEQGFHPARMAKTI